MNKLLTLTKNIKKFISDYISEALPYQSILRLHIHNQSKYILMFAETHLILIIAIHVHHFRLF